MPRVKQVVAAKDYPKFGIVKGQKHYHWKRKTGPYTSQEYRQVEPPRIEQMTSSAFKIAMHHLTEQVGNVTSPDDLDDVISAAEDLAAEQQEKFDNMPEGLQQGDTGQTLEQQASTLTEAAEEFGTIKEEWQAAIDEHATETAGYDEYQTALGEWDEESGEDEPEEVEDPGEFDDSDYTDRVGNVQLEP